MSDAYDSGTSGLPPSGTGMAPDDAAGASGAGGAEGESGVLAGDEWLAAVDPASGDMYYFNTATGETGWSLPPGARLLGLAVEDKGAAAAAGEPEDTDELGNPTRVRVHEDMTSRVFAKEGWAYKSDPVGKNFKKRWVVVDRVTRTVTWYGANPRFTLARYRVTEPPKGASGRVESEGAVDR